MNTILGIDLGTNSIGWAIREANRNLQNQIVKKGVLLFDKGVASEKGNEFPKVQKRTESRGKRRNYQAEKYRKWELLEFLIEKNMCPLTIEELNKWRKYVKGQKREYPQSEQFINWLRFDFNADGKPDFYLFDKDKHESYYLFRTKAASEKIEDLQVFKNNPEILGRVFYQLVQRRGFKGRDEEEAKTMLEGSKKTDTKGRNSIEEYLVRHKTLGAALYHNQKENGGRIRQRYNLRKDYENELKKICSVQGITNEDYKKLWKAIIWQRPLRSQKGLVGLCTFEKNKRRAAISHPLYQEYKTWVLINNLKIIPPEGIAYADYLKDKIYPLFIRKSDFEIKHILEQLGRDGAEIESKFNSKRQRETKVVALSNFAHFDELLGENWREEYRFENDIHTREAKTSKKNSNGYTIEDIWHVLFTYDSSEKLEEFAKEKLGLNDDAAAKFPKIKLNQGHATLGLSAVRKILPYLKRGFKYSTAVYLANLSKVIGGAEITEDLISYFVEEIEVINHTNDEQKTLRFTVNSLIKEHLESGSRYFIEDGRTLDSQEIKNIKEKLISNFGQRTWNDFSENKKSELFDFVSNEFKQFLRRKITDKRDIFLPMPRLHSEIFQVLQEKYNLPDENIKNLWHPSEQETYKNAMDYGVVDINGRTQYVQEKNLEKYLEKNQNAEYHGILLKLLGNPEPISKGFKNPMALKTLHKLKQLLNYLLITDQIDEQTRIVIEIARELNDNNKRAAIQKYQRDREKKNKVYIEQIEEINKEGKTNYNSKDKTLLRKMRLWDEQGGICLYTNETINKCDVLNGNEFDLEHTIPASMSFDSELKNMTLANSSFNRHIKAKQLPTRLANYDVDCTINGKEYTAIKPRLKFMEDKIEKLQLELKDNLRKTKYISDKGIKDKKIQDRHIIKFELDYWRKKHDTFTIKEYKPQWRNSQLRDTQIVTKYALPYLKTVFKHVSVQKGTVTDHFKEIYNVKLDEKKDRTKHSHHAVDAAILTLIPSSYEREKLLEEFFKARESKSTFHTSPKNWKNFDAGHIIEIENSVLANNLVNDRILTPTFKKVRKRGKIVKNDDGDTLWAKGDTIRGQLHSESLYGAIKEAKRDENNKIQFDGNKKMILEDEIKMVIRRKLVYKGPNDTEGFKSLAELEKIIVDRALFDQIESQVRGRSFKDALEQGIYMLDKDGEKVNKIRHIRCYVLLGRGTLKFDTALPVHEHSFKSDKEYKQTTYSVTEDNVYCLFYEGLVKGKAKREFKIISTFDLSGLKYKSLEDLIQEPYFNSLELGSGVSIPLKYPLQKGTKVIPYEKDKYELQELSETQLNDRVYKVIKFNMMGTPYLYLQHHIEARQDKDIDKALTAIDINSSPMRYKLKAAKFDFAIEGLDFEVKIDGTISWLF